MPRKLERPWLTSRASRGNFLNKIGQTYCRCAKTFSDEEKAELQEIGSQIASYKCFKKIFHNACKESVRDQIYGFFEVEAVTMLSCV